MGALSQWPVSPEGKDRAPSSFVPGLSSLKEIAWTTILTQEPRLLHDSMTNLNRTVDRLSKVAAKARRPTRHLGRGPPRTKSRPTRAYPPPICLKPQIPATSRRLRLVRRFRQPPPPHLQNSNLANPHRNFHPPRPKRRSPSLRASTSRLLFRLVPLPTKGSRPFPHPPKEHVGEIDAAKQIRSYRACTTGAY